MDNPLELSRIGCSLVELVAIKSSKMYAGRIQSRNKICRVHTPIYIYYIDYSSTKKRMRAQQQWGGETYGILLWSRNDWFFRDDTS